jgi:hypothetical protein
VEPNPKGYCKNNLALQPSKALNIQLNLVQFCLTPRFNTKFLSAYFATPSSA